MSTRDDNWLWINDPPCEAPPEAQERIKKASNHLLFTMWKKEGMPVEKVLDKELREGYIAHLNRNP